MSKNVFIFVLTEQPPDTTPFKVVFDLKTPFQEGEKKMLKTSTTPSDLRLFSIYRITIWNIVISIVVVIVYIHQRRMSDRCFCTEHITLRLFLMA